MNKSNFESLVLGYLKNQITDVYENNSNHEVTVNLKNVNLEIQGMEWEASLLKYLDRHDQHAAFSYGDGNWVTIHKKV